MSGFDISERPDDWEDLEAAVAEVVAHTWGDPDATRVGLRDQRRSGVDIDCQPRHLEGDHCGIQCRVTDDLDAETVREAAEAAEDYGTDFEEFVVATTATRDESVEEAVQSLAEERAGDGRFPVRVLWWGDVGRLLGNAALQRGETDLAVERYEATLALMGETGDEQGEADALDDLGAIALDREDLDAAEEHYRESLSLREGTDDEHGTATSRYRLGLVARERGEWETAVEHFHEASQEFLEISAGHDALDALADLVAAQNEAGDEDGAVETCALAIGVAEELELAEVETQLRIRYATLPARDVAEGTDELYSFAVEKVGVDPDPDSAITLFDRTWERREEVPPDSGAYDRAHAAGVFLAAMAEVYDLTRGDEAVDPDALLAAATSGDADLPDHVATVAAELRGDDPDVEPDDVDGDVEVDEDGELAADDVEKVAAAAVLDALQSRPAAS